MKSQGGFRAFFPVGFSKMYPLVVLQIRILLSTKFEKFCKKLFTECWQYRDKGAIQCLDSSGSWQDRGLEKRQTRPCEFSQVLMEIWLLFLIVCVSQIFIHHCAKMPKIIHLQREKFRLAHSLGGSSP